MNEIEALEQLKWIKNKSQLRTDKDFTQPLALAISALEKQIPKKVDRVGKKCPVCKCYLAFEPTGDCYCFNCGQAIDWSVE